MADKYEEELFSFLEDYADFLAHMVKDEQEKLSSLLSNSLPRIEAAIATAQANSKQMENFELSRSRLQEQAGYGGMTFSEMIENAPEEEQQSLQALLIRIQNYVETIQYSNTKSMRVARTNLLTINPEADLSGMSPAAAGSAYLKNRERRSDEGAVLRTKI